MDVSLSRSLPQVFAVMVMVLNIEINVTAALTCEIFTAQYLKL
jgi:hypothetical protein